MSMQPMAILNSGQGLPYPNPDERISALPSAVASLVTALDKKIVGTYANPTAVANAGTFHAGAVVWVQSSQTLQVWTGSSWVSIYPSTPRVYSGTTAPASNLGSVGDLYIRY